MALVRNGVEHTGAKKGTILCGAKGHNKGLEIQVLDEQRPGQGGPIQGVFRILHAGDNAHAPVLERYLNVDLTAEMLLRLLRQQIPACINVVNANGLIVKQADATQG